MTQMEGQAKIRRAIKNCENAHDAFFQAREEMRLAVKSYLTESFSMRGGMKYVAGELGVSLSQACNLKTGFAIPSVEMAMRISLIEPPGDKP
jgi:hypothetical protein